MTTVLVTGCAGFIGSHATEKLLANGHTVIGVDNFNDYYNPRIKENNISTALAHHNFTLYRADLEHAENLAPIFQNHPITTILHLAARAGLRASLEQPGSYYQSNVNATINLLERARKHAIQNFVYASSSSVYMGNTKIPWHEDDPVNTPINPYAATKRAGELACYTYHHLYHIPITCLRFFSVYGPRGRPDMIPYKFTNLIDTGKPITVYGDGTMQRDYTYVDDIISGILSALEKKFPYEIINLGNSQPVQVNKLINVIETILGKKARVHYTPQIAGEAHTTYADLAKAQHLLNYKPTTSIEEGMRNFITWYSQHKQLLI